MYPSTPPKLTAVEIVAAQPTEADSAAIEHLGARASKALPQVTYLVKLRFETMPPVMSQGWALYVNDFRIPKYWAYEDGVYFKVFDEQFFQDHQGESLRFSQNGNDFADTGLKLTSPITSRKASVSKVTELPLQADVLKKQHVAKRPASKVRPSARPLRKRK